MACAVAACASRCGALRVAVSQRTRGCNLAATAETDVTHRVPFPRSEREVEEIRETRHKAHSLSMCVKHGFSRFRWPKVATVWLDGRESPRYASLSCRRRRSASVGVVGRVLCVQWGWTMRAVCALFASSSVTSKPRQRAERERRAPRVIQALRLRILRFVKRVCFTGARCGGDRAERRGARAHGGRVGRGVRRIALDHVSRRVGVRGRAVVVVRGLRPRQARRARHSAARGRGALAQPCGATNSLPHVAGAEAAFEFYVRRLGAG